VQACQRHWTDGGTLRKVETGAGKRNSRRARGSGSLSTSEAGLSGHNKYARVSRVVPQQNWSHEDFLQLRPQSVPAVPGGAPSYLDAAMPEHNSSDANISFQEGSSFHPDKVRLPMSPSNAHSTCTACVLNDTSHNIVPTTFAELWLSVVIRLHGIIGLSASLLI
jgi:hypothetical protein